MAAVFGGLLMQADPVFERLMTRAFAVELDRLVSHLGVIFLWGWVAARVNWGDCCFGSGRAGRWRKRPIF